MSAPKITFIGAGSTVFVKNILGDVFQRPALKSAHIALMDIDETRLEESHIVVRKLMDSVGAKGEISCHRDRKTALQGAVESSGFAKPHSTSHGQTAAPYPQAHYYMRQTRNCAGRKAPPSGWACGLPRKLRLCRAVFLWYTGTGSSPPLRALF
mgnify:CR=1 FL=1